MYLTYVQYIISFQLLLIIELIKTSNCEKIIICNYSQSQICNNMRSKNGKSTATSSSLHACC